jgi:hypothetical protein
MTAIAHDTTNAAASATVGYYTANPTGLGTTVGMLRAFRTPMPNMSETGNGAAFNMDNGLVVIEATTPSQAIMLRSASEVLAVNFNAGTAAGNVVAAFIEWTEEPG